MSEPLAAPDAGATLPTTPEAFPPAARVGYPTKRRRQPRRDALLWCSAGWLVLIVLVAVFVDVLPLHRHDTVVTDLAPRTAPRLSFDEPLGTDGIGRSMLSRLAFGARQSLLAATLSTAIALFVGLTLGTLAGYFRKLVDELVSGAMEVLLALPGIVLLLAIASVGRRDMTTLVAGLAVIGVPSFTRLARANALSLADREFVSAAVAMGATHRRVLVREIVPMVVLRLSTFAVLFLAVVIVLEASLSFLGLGVPPPRPSWGAMVNEGRSQLAGHPQLVFIPAACIVFTVAAFQVVGDRLRRQFESPRGAQL